MLEHRYYWPRYDRKMPFTVQYCFFNSSSKKKTFSQDFHGGKKDLAKFKSDAESFVCALMPGSSSVQIKTTPGRFFSS